MLHSVAMANKISLLVHCRSENAADGMCLGKLGLHESDGKGEGTQQQEMMYRRSGELEG